jgi:3-methyl-2-oxobutanoate hydroxymethyltransferase
MKNTIKTIQKAKETGEKITVLTAYDYTMAKLINDSGIMAILVGDSLGNVILGYEDTLSVTMDDMIHHCKAVSRAATQSLLIVDMPFMSYQVSVEEAVRNAGRLMKEGRANAVKLEGGRNVCPQIAAIVAAGIPVVAHLGLTPQSVNALGGFKIPGKTAIAAQNLIDDALAVEQAGAFALTLECVPQKLAALITEKLSIPTIGIGSGAACSGQVLVTQDMLGMNPEFTPKFVKTFAHMGEEMKETFRAYVKEVSETTFPTDDNSYSIENEVIDKLY